MGISKKTATKAYAKGSPVAKHAQGAKGATSPSSTTGSNVPASGGGRKKKETATTWNWTERLPTAGEIAQNGRVQGRRLVIWTRKWISRLFLSSSFSSGTPFLHFRRLILLLLSLGRSSHG